MITIVLQATNRLFLTSSDAVSNLNLMFSKTSLNGAFYSAVLKPSGCSTNALHNSVGIFEVKILMSPVCDRLISLYLAELSFTGNAITMPGLLTRLAILS